MSLLLSQHTNILNRYVLANRKTLIVRILGVYKLTMNDYGNSLYLYVVFCRVHENSNHMDIIHLLKISKHTLKYYTGTVCQIYFHHLRKVWSWERSTTSKDQQERVLRFVRDLFCIVVHFLHLPEHYLDASSAVKSSTQERTVRTRKILMYVWCIGQSSLSDYVNQILWSTISQEQED